MPSVEAWARCADAEGIVHVDLSQRGQRLRELRIVGFFFGVEAQIFEQQHLAGLELVGHLLGDFAYAVGEKATFHARPDVLIEQLAQPVDDRAQRVLRIRLALGTAEVRGQNHLRLVPQGVFDGGQCGPNAGVVGDRLSRLRSVAR